MEGLYHHRVYTSAALLELALRTFGLRFLRNTPADVQRASELETLARTVRRDFARAHLEPTRSWPLRAVQSLCIAANAAAELRYEFELMAVRRGLPAFDPGSLPCPELDAVVLEVPKADDPAAETRFYRLLRTNREKTALWLESENPETVLAALLQTSARIAETLNRMAEAAAKRIPRSGLAADRPEAERDRTVHRRDRDDRRPNTPRCPKCGSAMRLKTIRNGERAGQQFWSCSEFPACDGTRNVRRDDGGDPSRPVSRGDAW